MNLREITEATTSGTIPPTGTSSQGAGGLGNNTELPFTANGEAEHNRAKIGQDMFGDENGTEVGGKVKSIHSDGYDMETDDGRTIRIKKDRVLNPKNLVNQELLNRPGDTTLGKIGRAARATASAVATGASYANSKKVSVNSSEEPDEKDELNRLQELAGVKQEVPGGSKTVIGNTAHRPTDRLRARLRREKLKKK